MTVATQQNALKPLGVRTIAVDRKNLSTSLYFKASPQTLGGRNISSRGSGKSGPGNSKDLQDSLAQSDLPSVSILLAIFVPAKIPFSIATNQKTTIYSLV